MYDNLFPVKCREFCLLLDWAGKINNCKMLARILQLLRKKDKFAEDEGYYMVEKKVEKGCNLRPPS